MTDDETSEVLAAIAALPWTFAKTYAATAPHEYVVAARSTNPAAYRVLDAAIKQHATPGDFWGRTYQYLLIPGHGWKYWRYDILINRAKVTP
jgi:hypothetical protein